MTTAERLWVFCTDALRSQVGEATWKTWFDGVRAVELRDDTLVLSVPSSLVKERLEARYLEHIEQSLLAANATPLAVSLVLRPPADRPGDEAYDVSTPAPGTSRAPVSPAPQPASPDTTRPAGHNPLNPKYTFDAFVCGPSNRFAHAAALSVAETPGKSYNPLFVHGDSGLGKTHLLHAIGNYVRENFRNRLVRYVTSETFLNEFVDSIRTNTSSEFKRRYRGCDVLLVDDMQFIEGKEGLQEEFFHTFNELYQSSKQIVITSDRPPRSFVTLEDRLRSRLVSGLTAAVQPPDLETRLAILRKKAGGDRDKIPDEVFELIATHVKDNIRELEGALLRVTAFASIHGEHLTSELAASVLSDMIASKEPRPVTPGDILDATAKLFGFSVDELRGASRRRPLVTARQVAMYVMRELTDYSYPAIGREFGGRDHTTVIHAVEKISALMMERRQIYDQVTELIQCIRAGG